VRPPVNAPATDVELLVGALHAEDADVIRQVGVDFGGVADALWVGRNARIIHQDAQADHLKAVAAGRRSADQAWCVAATTLAGRW
jgi:hypothetical protein